MKHDYLKQIINYGHHEAIKHWLKISGLKPHTASIDADFYKLLDRHIGDGNIQIDQLRRLTLELSEYGQKRIYLGKLINFKTIKLKERFETHLKTLRLKIDAVPKRGTELPTKPHLDYIFWSQEEVRIGYSETHTAEKADRSTRTWKTIKQTNYITISANPGTGTISLIMDAPLETHPHQATFRGEEPLGYIPFYRAKAIELLGVDEFKSLDFVKIARGLASDKTVFERVRSTDLTKHNSRVTTTSRSEVSDDPAYTAGARVDGEDRVYEGLGGFWLAEGSEKQLQRKVFMNLNQHEQMVQFPGINLAREIEYALSRIRSI
jgi:hypothetical protein